MGVGEKLHNGVHEQSTNEPTEGEKRSDAMIARPEGSLHTVGKAVGKADEMVSALRSSPVWFFAYF